MKKTFGNQIASMRREKGMTQSELAEKMGVTDKAVSKWERDLSCPDVSSIPRLAEIFGISVDELMQGKTESKEKPAVSRINTIIDLVLKGVALAMGVATAVLSIMNKVEMNSAVTMLGIGLACLAVAQFSEKKD